MLTNDEKKRRKALRRLMELQGSLALMRQYFLLSTQDGDPPAMSLDLALDYEVLLRRLHRQAFRVQVYLDECWLAT